MGLASRGEAEAEANINSCIYWAGTSLTLARVQHFPANRFLELQNLVNRQISVFFWNMSVNR